MTAGAPLCRDRGRGRRPVRAGRGDVRGSRAAARDLAGLMAALGAPAPACESWRATPATARSRPGSHTTTTRSGASGQISRSLSRWRSGRPLSATSTAAWSPSTLRSSKQRVVGAEVRFEPPPGRRLPADRGPDRPAATPRRPRLLIPASLEHLFGYGTDTDQGRLSLPGQVRFQVDEAAARRRVPSTASAAKRRAPARRSRTAPLTVPGSFEITEDEALLGVHRPADGWHKSFSGACGSQLFTRSNERPGPDQRQDRGKRQGYRRPAPGLRPSSSGVQGASLRAARLAGCPASTSACPADHRATDSPATWSTMEPGQQQRRRRGGKKADCGRGSPTRYSARRRSVSQRARRRTPGLGAGSRTGAATASAAVGLGDEPAQPPGRTPTC